MIGRVAGLTLLLLVPSAHAGGVAHGTGFGTSRAEACNRALNEAASTIRERIRAVVREKKCECNKGESPNQSSRYKDISGHAAIQRMESWSCTGFVSYEVR